MDREKIPEYAILITGLLLLATPLGFVVVAPGAFGVAQFYLKLVAALGGALIGAFIPGALHIEFPGVRAGGALAVFYLVFTADPTTAVYEALRGESKSYPLDFAACQDQRIYHASGRWRSDASARVIDEKLVLRSDKGGLIQLVKVCGLELAKPATKFDLEIGAATINYVTDDVLGAQGSGLGILLACGRRSFDNSRWDFWKDDGFAMNQFFAPNPRAASTLDVPRSSISVSCPIETRELTFLIVLSDPWKDTEMTARLDSIRVLPHPVK